MDFVLNQRAPGSALLSGGREDQHEAGQIAILVEPGDELVKVVQIGELRARRGCRDR